MVASRLFIVNDVTLEMLRNTDPVNPARAAVRFLPAVPANIA